MTQIMRNPRIAMAGLLLLAFLIRTVGLGYCPPSMNSDELLKAFDGASVYLTGMDHHGDRWPLFFKQSGEFSPPLYIYFSGLFSAPFGINPYTLRLPSAILGTLSVLMVYLLASHWRGNSAGWIAALLVALSPWNIHYSRIGWEAISLIPLQLCGLWLFLRWTQEGKKRDLYLAAAAFALTTYAYPTARLYTPLIGVGLLACFFQKLKAYPKDAALGAGLFLLIQVPLVYALLTNYQAMQARWNFVSVFNNPDGLSLAFTNYFKHLSPIFLFISGNTNPAHQLPGGLALLVLAPFFLLGLVSIFQQRKGMDRLMLFWFLTFAIPSSLTYDRFDPSSMPNALRSVNGMPILELISAAGICWLLCKAPKRMETPLKWGIATLVIINAAYVGYASATVYRIHAAKQNQYGLDKVVEYVEENKAKYDRVVFSHAVRLHPISLAVFSHRKPGPFSAKDYPKYIIPFYHYVPIYSDFHTDIYQRYAGQNLNSIARWYNLAPGKNLLVALPNEIGGALPIDAIKSLDGSTAYEVYETNR